MDRKELTSGEAEPLDYGYRVPFYSTMELFIETLTGTCFELRVSPFETVISVKAKIQRLEGIPISQQYLIWHNTELEDDYCLHDYSITDGCTLKLVLAMRGGPINTRRIAMEEPTFREMADYVDANHEELFDNLSTPPSAGNPGSNKQVTLLVYRDGDQLNFFRVVDRGDGTLTPLSESLSGGSISNMEDEEEGEVSQQKLTVSQVVENNITASKMKQLRSNMHDLSIKGGTTSIKKKMAASRETPILPPGQKSDELKMSMVRRHLSFSPKDSVSLRQMPKLHPNAVKTAPVNLFGDSPSSLALPQQPPPSAEKAITAISAVSETTEPKPPNSEKLLKHTSEKSPKTKAQLDGKPNACEAPEKHDTPLLGAEISEGDVCLKPNKFAVNETGRPGSSTPMHTPTGVTSFSTTTTISKADLLRARLNRIKQTMNSREAKEEIVKNPLPGNKASGKSASSSDSCQEDEGIPVEAPSASENPSLADNSSGKRSPRTQRLLAALSNNGKTGTTSATQSAKKKVPVSTLPRYATSITQGLAFNRHDMYLRSYGLLPSPDDDNADDTVKFPPPSLSDTTLKPRLDEVGPVSTIKAPQSSKILETPHGVKYTTSGVGTSYYSRPWYDRTPRSPVTTARSRTGTQGPLSSATKDNSKSDYPSSYSLFHPYHRDLKPIVRAPQGHQTGSPSHTKLGAAATSSAISKTSFGSYGRTPTWLADRTPTSNEPPTPVAGSSIQRWTGSSSQSQDKPSEHGEGVTTHGSKDLNSAQTHHPRPPSSGVGGLRYQSRRQVITKAMDKTRPTQSTSNTTTSAVRINDSPHGKLETMSRQEAREVVDFINKAMDASILRSLVKSPGKESHRGSSGQSSFRHAPVPYHHYGDPGLYTTETGPKYTASNTSRMGSKVDMAPLNGPRLATSAAHTRLGTLHPNSMLPPVKSSTTKKKKCFLCGKKTGLATSYTCRCGNNFCATHRYAETHDCTYDYKTRGRKLLEENNPLVSAPKLPKI